MANSSGRIALDLIASHASDAAEPFRLLAESIPQLVWTARPDGRLDWTNQRWVKYTGLQIEDSRGWAWQQAIHDQDLSACLSAWTTAIDRGEALEVKVRVRDQQGAYRWFLVRAEPIVNREQLPTCWFGTFTDIHDEEQKLLAAERSFQTSVDNLLDCFGIYKAVRNQSGAIVDFEVEFVNKAACEANQLSYEQQVGKRLNTILPGHVESGLFEAYCKVVETGEPFNAEMKAYADHYDGRPMERWFDIRASKLADGFVAAWRDVTAKRVAAQQVYEAEARFRLAIQHSPIIVYQCDTQLRYTWIYNPQHDAEPEQIIGKRDDEILPLDCVAELIHFKQKVLAEQRGGRKVIPLVHNGKTYRYAVTLEPLRNTEGIATGLTAVAINVTDGWPEWERKIMERPADDGEAVLEKIAKVPNFQRADVNVARLAAALQESEERFRNLADNIAQLAWMKDADGYTYWYNRRWYEYTGTTFAEMEGWGWRKVHHPEHVERVTESLKAALASGQPWDVTFPLRAANGQFRWFLTRAIPIKDELGRIVRWFGTNTDITDQLNVEKQLRERQAVFESVFATIDDGYCVAEILTDQAGQPQDYRFLEVNPRFEEMTGLKDAAGKTAYELVPELEKKWVDFYARVGLDGEVLRFEERSEAMGRDFDVFATPIEPRGRFVLVFKDITDRKRAEQQLRSRERWFRELADAAPAMLWITNSEHLCTFISRGWLEFTGRPEYQVLGERWSDVIHPEDREHVLDEFSHAANEHRSFEVDFRMAHSTGSYRWVTKVGRPRRDAYGNFEGYIGSVIDIDKRKTTEALLRESQQRFQIAAEAVAGIIYEYDLETGRVERSTGLETVVGFKPDEASPTIQWWLDRIHPEDREPIEKQSNVTASTPGKISQEYRVLHRDGHWVHVWDQAMVVGDDEGRSKRVIGCTVDVTPQKNFAQSLVQAREAAENANRSRGEFLANMSHEIRTPMTAILGYADILSEHLSDPDNLQLVETIRKNGQFLLEIINDILDLSKIDAGMLEMNDERVRLDTLIEDIRALIEIRANEKNLPLRVTFDGPFPEVIETDALRLRQILLNLLGNAIKFTNRGQVELVTRYLPSAEKLQFEVIDSGVGIRSEDLGKLFQPFTQADSSSTRSAGGTGLGLTISRRLARALGGDISVESEFRKGSKFTLTIHCPRQNVALRRHQQPAARKMDAPTFDSLIGTTILVVDDRRDIRFLAQTFIEKAGGKVLLASNGVEAIEVIDASETSSPGIDLVLMDMQMPIMDGFKATQTLRGQGFAKPIIALTANAMKSDREDCIAAGCTDYASKPLIADRLIGLIAKHACRNQA